MVTGSDVVKPAYATAGAAAVTVGPTFLMVTAADPLAAYPTLLVTVRDTVPDPSWRAFSCGLRAVAELRLALFSRPSNAQEYVSVSPLGSEEPFVSVTLAPSSSW
jgi:hypothetical protein